MRKRSDCAFGECRSVLFGFGADAAIYFHVPAAKGDVKKYIAFC